MGQRTVTSRRGPIAGAALLAVLTVGALPAVSAAGSCASITCGETKAGALAVLGEVDCFTFTVQANETVSITTSLTAGFFTPCWNVTGPTGDLGEVCGQNTRTLGVAGTYTINVHDRIAPPAQIGAYDVSLVVVSDTPSNCAQSIGCGQTLARSLAMIGESDTYRFAGQAGDTLSITTQEIAGGMAGCWELYDPAGISLGGVCGQAERTLAVAGGYTVRTYDDDDAETGSYDVTVTVVSDSTSSCAETIGCGQTLARTLADVGESDTYRFAADAGETVSITGQETAGGLSVCWELYDPQGISIRTACGQEQRTLAVAGDYTIRVYDNNDMETGTYDVNLVFVSDTASNCAEAIACGQNLARSVDDVAQSNTYRFTAVADETVSITAQETSAFLTACWELYDPEGISVVGACGQAEKTLAVGGDYTIRVSDGGDDETGTYNLALVVVSDTASNCAEAITCGSTLDRNIATTGESDTYRFVAAAGEAVSVATTETGGFLDACWEIYDPDGISLGGICGQAEKTLAVAGGYTIRVADNNDVETGTYDVNLVVVSDTSHNCAQPIACGDLVMGSLDRKGESDTYGVSGQTGDMVAIETTEIGGLLNACWEFYDPTGASLGGFCGEASRTLATNLGAYTLRVYDQGENDSGDYQVALCNPTTTTTATSTTSTTAAPVTTTTVSIGGTTTTLAGSVEQRLGGTTLALKDVAGKPTKRKLLIVASDPSLSIGAPGSAEDPTVTGGTLRVRTTAGDRFDTTYVLEPSGWRPYRRRDPSKGWKYSKGPAIRFVLVKAGSALRILGKGPGLGHRLAADPNPVDVVLTLGARRYCLRFGGETDFTPGKRFIARGATAPADCP
ncbi:MAG TPA: hypothetical protein VKA21_16820 [Candidatus Binatia bacterium]|nr:hypothetical protein [Candidatus Binatia bacterium]